MKCKRCGNQMKHAVREIKESNWYIFTNAKILDAYECVCGYKKGVFRN